jgi:hypothetical protein
MAALIGPVLAAGLAAAPGQALAWNCPVEIRAAEQAIKRAESANLPPEARPLVEDARRLLAESVQHHTSARSKIDHANAMWKARAAQAEAESAAALATP